MFHFDSLHPQDWTIRTADKQGLAVTSIVNSAKLGLTKWISNHVDALDHTIARINNGAVDQAKQNTTFLQPKSFIFTTTGDETHPVLTIYMDVEGGSDTQGDPAASITQFATNTSTTLPQGYTASIILSNELLVSKITDPMLVNPKMKFTRVGNKTGDGGDTGIEYNVFLDESFSTHPYEEGSVWSRKISYSAQHFDFKTVPIKLSIGDGVAHWSLNHYIDFNWTTSHFPGNDVIGTTRIHFVVKKVSACDMYRALLFFICH